MNLYHLLKEAYKKARCEERAESSEKAKNAARSKSWVRELGNALHKYESGSYLFTASHKSNRSEFGLNELLYDICIVRTEKIEAAVRKNELSIVTSAIWQVESEFENNSRAAAVDFSKLVIGSAENKLFIGPHISNEAHRESYKVMLGKMAKYVTGNCYLAMVPHPSEWACKDEKMIQCWCFSEENGGWVPYAL